MHHKLSSTDRSSGTGRSLRRRAAVGALATLILTGLPAVAHATPPVHQPPANATYDIHLAAGEVPCGPITITYTDNERYTTRSDGVTIVTGQLDAIVASDTTKKSVSLKVSGPGKFNPDGSVTGGGAWLLFGSEVLAYATGRILIPASGVNDVQVRGQRTDLCALLGF
jgi:hypothetical protein